MTRRSFIRHKFLELRARVFTHMANRLFANKQAGKVDTADGPDGFRRASAQTKG